MHEAIAPGQQGVLFTPAVHTLTFTAVEPSGASHHTDRLGIALAIARRIARDCGQAWSVASDGTTAHLTPSGVESAYCRPWIATVTEACKEQP